MLACGINNIYMAGTREDWVRIIKKLNCMEKLDVNGKLKEYIHHMEIILNNFLLTFDGKPNVEWWNTSMRNPKASYEYLS